MTHTAITAHAPAQHNVVIDRGRRQVYRCGDKGACGACPSRATSQRVAAACADSPSVTASDKAAARSNNVRKRPAVDTDFQHAAVKCVLQVVVLAKSQLRGSVRNRNNGRIEPLVTYRTRIVYPRGIGQ